MKKILHTYGELLVIAAVIVILDQLTQAWIHQNLSLGEIYRPELWLSRYARLVYVKNTGAAFGIFMNLGGVFTAISALISLAILFAYPRISRQDWLIRLAMGLYLGGALGNLLDRLTFGYVTDFISIGAFPVFNIADMSISIGTAVFILGVIIQENRGRSRNQPPGNIDPPRIEKR